MEKKMKIILASLLTLCMLPASLSAQSKFESSFTIIYELTDLCDSGFCDAKACSVTNTDSYGYSKTNLYYDGESAFPRVCKLLEAGEQISLKFKYGRTGSGICIQIMEKSDREVTDLIDTDCFAAN